MVPRLRKKVPVAMTMLTSRLTPMVDLQAQAAWHWLARAKGRTTGRALRFFRFQVARLVAIGTCLADSSCAACKLPNSSSLRSAWNVICTCSHLLPRKAEIKTRQLEDLAMRILFAAVVVLSVLAVGTPAYAILHHRRAAYYAPVTTNYAPAVTTAYYAPTTAYYAPTTAYAPTTTYYAPAAAPVTTYYSSSVPVTTYYAPAAATPVTTYYAPARPVTTYYAPPSPRTMLLPSPLGSPHTTRLRRPRR